MTPPLKVHWSRSKPNFGDWLSPALCEMLSGRSVVYAPVARCDLVAVGSLWERLPSRWLSRRVDVWGTGAIQAHAPRRGRHRYHALRGPLTAGLLLGHTVAVLGDPGLLAPRLLPDRALPKRHALGIVPHYKDARLRCIAELSAHFGGAPVIDVFEAPVRVIERIAACHVIVSSSLHGLVVAEALGIPAVWLVASGQVRGAGWKFRDYYGAFGVIDPRPFSAAELLGSSLADLEAAAPRPAVSASVDALAASFPFRP
jgi:pyruvyltransferase